MSNTKAGSSRQFQEGDDMDSIGKSAESWLKTERVPELPTEAPTNMAVVHFSHYTTKKVEAELLRLVEGLDVVLVATNKEAATVMASRLAVHTESLLLVDFSDTTARECYLRWLADLAEKYPRVRVTFIVVGPHPKCGDPSLLGGSFGMQYVLQMARNADERAHGDGRSSPGRPAELFLRIPVDDVPRWAKGKRDGSTFIVPAERGTLCVEPRGSDDGHTLFYVCRLETGENVAYVNVITDGEGTHDIDADVMDALEPFPEGSEVDLCPIPCSEHEEAKATEPRNGDSAAPREVDEEGEPNEPDNR